MNADKLKELIYKLETKGDVSKKEANEIYSLFNKTTLKKAINPFSVYTEDDLFFQTMAWLRAVLAKLERKESGNFIMSLPIKIRHYYGPQESANLEKLHVEILLSLSPVDRAEYIIASKEIYDTAKDKTYIAPVSSDRPNMTKRAKRVGFLYRERYRDILSPLREISVLRNSVNPPIFHHTWKYGNRAFKGWVRSDKKSFYTPVILKAIKEVDIPFANVIYISRLGGIAPLPKESETTMVPEKEAKIINHIVESNIIIDRLQKTGLINVSGKDIHSVDMFTAIEAGGRLFLEEYKRICIEQKLLKETWEEADEWLEFNR
jgi:hypothetical protein